MALLEGVLELAVGPEADEDGDGVEDHDHDGEDESDGGVHIFDHGLVPLADRLALLHGQPARHEHLHS